MQQPPPTPEEFAEYEAMLAEYQALNTNSRLDKALEWIASLILAAVFLAVYFTRGSVTLAILISVPVTALLVWGLNVVNRHRVRPSLEWLQANAHRFQQERD